MAISSDEIKASVMVKWPMIVWGRERECSNEEEEEEADSRFNV